ncbi:hypothetical protein [Pseudescherichia sp.]|uniref:hypothetical protein n=1 Tax=Pseudescherichia sp. TaxID=2055881 RepID=UPI0028A7AC9A|nr:hypothetical protein [Pseudescherichia sp.]
MSDKYAGKPFRADGGDIGSGRIKEIADNVYGDEEKIWLAKRVLALLAERDADRARIAELEAVERTSTARREALERTHKLYQRERGRADSAEQRIAELEARTLIVKLPSLNPQMFNDDVMFGYRKAQREAVEFCAAAGISLKIEGE